jgi:hypothetical protein
MQVKGAAVESIPKFVQSKFGERYSEWINSLSDDSKQIIQEKLLSNSWYPIDLAVIEPMQKICEMFYSGDHKGAWEIGRFAAEIALKGVYKLFVKIGNPKFMIMRASGIISSYYRPGDVKIIELKANAVAIYLSNFNIKHHLIENRIAGWIERAFEINGCKNVQMKINQSMTKGNDVCEMIVSWQ